MKITGFLKPTKKKLIILAVILIVAIIGFNFFGKKKQIPLQFSQVKKQDIKSIVSSSGSLTGKSVANLKFKSAGKLAYIKVKAGDTVSKDDIIAGLDTQDLNIELQQAQNTLRDKQATAQKIEDDVKDHSSDETFAQRATRTAAQAARDSAYDSVKAAQRAFQDTVITSPISGIVTQAIAVSGQTVTAADIIAQIVDTSGTYFDTDVDEADIGKVSVGMMAEITLDAYSAKAFKGSVDQILPQTKTTSSGATVVTVRIKMLDLPDAFVNGLSGDSSIITETALNVLTIPIEALRDDNSVVIKTASGIVSKKVVTGIQSDNSIEIKGGISENDKVVLNPK